MRHRETHMTHIRTDAGKRPGRGSRRAGVAMIEAAGVTLLLILLMLGIMEVARALMTYNLLTRAVREGARLAAIKPDLAVGDSQVLSRISTLLADGGAAVAESEVSFIGSAPNPNDPLRGEMVRVRARVDFLPAVSMVFGSGAAIPLQAQVIARHE